MARARKLFIGPRLREIRESLVLTQAGFASALGLSTSYLNQLENNHRHASAAVLLALAERFSVDIATLSDHEGDRLLADLAEALADPLFAGLAPGARELQHVAQNAPTLARAFLLAHQTHRRQSDQLVEIDDSLERAGAAEPSAWDEVRDHFHYLDNYVHALDLAGEAFAAVLGGTGPSRHDALARRLQERHDIDVTLHDGGTTLRHLDATRGRLTLNTACSSATRAFQMAHQIALLEHGDTLDALAREGGFRSRDAHALCRLGLANFFAGAALMPYARFAMAAAELRHDLHRLADRFGTSLEQVAHRLSTLQRPGAKGVPFFFARVDQAGNITKRHSATSLRFARFGSACPLWNVHRAFQTPDRIIRQLAETPDGARYLCLATTVTRRTGGFADPVQRHALALGCEVRHAASVVYGDGLDTTVEAAFEPIGVSCRICEREQCHQRALPPSRRALVIDSDARGVLPYGLTDRQGCPSSPSKKSAIFSSMPGGSS